MKTKEVELTLEDLRKTTWDCGKEDFVGLYKNNPVWCYMFEVVSCSVDRSLLTARKCNAEEGWIEFIECAGDPVKDKSGKIILPGSPKIDADFNLVSTKINCSMVVNILSIEDANIIATIESERKQDDS